MSVALGNRLAARLARNIPPRAGEASIAVVDARRSRTLNRRYRSRNYVPDVLSFSLADSEQAGEVVLTREKLEAQARHYGWPVAFEFARLTLHGLLHVSGMNHHRRMERLRMERRERRMLGELFPSLRINPAVQSFLHESR